MSKRCTAVIDKLTIGSALGGENTNVVDVLVSFLLVISPLLQHYKGVVVNAGILVLILCLPYVCLKLLFRFRSLKLKNALIALPLVLFQIFRVLDHGMSFVELAHGVVLCGYFVAIPLGGINLKYVLRFAYLVAMAAGLGIIIQSICHYVFGFHLQLVVTEMLLEESSAWIRLAETGVVGITGNVSAFYRPSAFFLEPSHMFLYFVPNLLLLLLSREMNWMKRASAVVLSLGLMLSTSGMGIALVAGAWLLHLGFGKGKENLLRFKHLFSVKNILRCVAFVMIFIAISISLPFMRYSILRVFIGGQAVNAMITAEEAEKAVELAEAAVEGREEALRFAEEKTAAAEEAARLAEENTGSTAVSGRIERAISLIRYKMSGSQYFVGVSDSVEGINFNLPGFFSTMYKYGIIGTVLSYVFYLCCAVVGKGACRWTAILVLVISMVSAHTHGTFYMLFYVLMLMDGIVPRLTERDVQSQMTN